MITFLRKIFTNNVCHTFQITYCINLILAVMKRSVWPDDTEVRPIDGKLTFIHKMYYGKCPKILNAKVSEKKKKKKNVICKQ